MILRTVYAVDGTRVPTSSVLDVDKAFATLLSYDLGRGTAIRRGTQPGRLILRQGVRCIEYFSEDSHKIAPLIATAGYAARMEGQHEVADECSWMLHGSGYDVPPRACYVHVLGLSPAMHVAMGVTQTFEHARLLKHVLRTVSENEVLEALGALLVDDSLEWRAAVIQSVDEVGAMR